MNAHDPLWAIVPLLTGIALIVVLNLPSRALAVLGATGAVIALLAWLRPFWIIYLPPTAIDLLIAFLFGRTLVRGRVPLIEQYMRVAHSDLHPRVVRHARQLTWVWVCVMTALGLVAALLAVSGRAEAWYRFVNLDSLLLVAAVFLVEYLYRLVFFTREYHTSPLQILRIVVQARFRRARSGQAPPAD